VDSTFTYWTSDGRPYEVPIVPFLVPAGAKLGPAHRCLHAHNEGILGHQSSAIEADQAVRQAKELRQTG
jgi:hypothetical protein